MIRLDLATDAFIGARSQQQDAAGAYGFGSAGGAVLVLGDGLGGHTGGAEASHIVRETFREAASAGVFDEQVARHGALLDALEHANQRIANGVDPAHGQRGMASTAVVVVVAEDNADWISVGDSHFYVWRAGHLAKLNEDHSQAGLMLRSGNYKPTDPEVVAAKSILVSALTGRRLELIDHPDKPFKLQPGDLLLLASDGLNTLRDDEVEALLTNANDASAAEISSMLLDAVRNRRADRQDNTAVVVARVMGVADPSTVSRTEVVIPTQITAPSDAKTAIAPEQAANDKPNFDKTITVDHAAAATAVAAAAERLAAKSGQLTPLESGTPAVQTTPLKKEMSPSTRPTFPSASQALPLPEPRRSRSTLTWVSAVLFFLALLAAIQYLGLWTRIFPSSTSSPPAAATKAQPASQPTPAPPVQQPATTPAPQQTSPPVQSTPTATPGAPVILPPAPSSSPAARPAQAPAAPPANNLPPVPEPTITPGAGHSDVPAPRLVVPPAPTTTPPAVPQPAPAPQR